MKNSFHPTKHHLTLRPVTVALLLFVFLSMSRSAYAQWTTTGNDIYNTNTGNVGIGTNGAPTATLEVKKTQNAATTVTVDNPYTTAGHFAYSGFVMKQNGVIRAHLVSVNDNHNFIPAGTVQLWNFTNGPIVFATNSTEQMRISGAGNVGIGTNAPDVKLQIHHASSNTNVANIGLADLSFAFRNTSNTNGNMSLISFQDSAGWGNAQIGAIQKDQTNHSADLVFFTREATAFGERMRIRSDGKVGIGVNVPTAKLHLLASDGQGLRMYRDGNFANWGIAQFFALNNSSNVPTDYAQVSGGITDNTAGAEKGVLAFYTRGAGSLSEKMRVSDSGVVSIGTPTTNTLYRLDVQGGKINSSDGLCIAGDCKTSWSAVGGSQWLTSGTTINYSTGNVGIATPSPTEKLHVTGNVKVVGSIDVSGNINAKYQDVAEWVESSQELPAGTVVVLDDTRSNQVIASTEAYDSRVAGVISLKPGIALGERGENHVLVATTGRVKVKVDASNGPIKIGDLLVTSDKEGVAMKSIPIELGGARIHRPGTLIGKALEPLASGTGEILVLLSLQ